jgi:hypothetical protein
MLVKRSGITYELLPDLEQAGPGSLILRPFLLPCKFESPQSTSESAWEFTTYAQATVSSVAAVLRLTRYVMLMWKSLMDVGSTWSVWKSRLMPRYYRLARCP